ncbi:MAG: flavodoxin-dependent (E)-4-hydroxy-3-methylbut-2-enyl-diphosphate synthase [Lachnospiraceae bacterium]|nr:flavodoxin-dependent (E)-4-hydroxy-3-methylbut-2-enyl-diphosphate synthase [Lachnospiraceae bacterium]
MRRDETKEIRIGDRVIGHGNPILIQSMTNTPTENAEATVSQILRLEEAGCEIIRVTVPTVEAAEALPRIRKEIHIPLVADIHFDYRLAILSAENGADKIRINPGNIGGPDRIRAVVNACKEREIPIRVGVNSGSLEKELVEKYGGVTAEGLVESALDKVRMIEDAGYDRMVVSIKSSNVLMCVRAHELLSEQCAYPLHVGITEAGADMPGTVKSSIGMAMILERGIGDTVRVSLTGDPVQEVRCAKEILRTLGLRKGGIEIISCPTCGRTKIDLPKLVREVSVLKDKYPALDLKLAVMGCIVNGPGEAREADLGIAGGVGSVLLIKHGEVVAKIDEKDIVNVLDSCLASWQ